MKDDPHSEEWYLFPISLVFLNFFTLKPLIQVAPDVFASK